MITMGKPTPAGTYLQKLVLANPLVEPTVREVIDALELPQGSRGLDAGCGIGLQALLLAGAVGPAGHVTGLDLSPEFLTYAKGLAGESGLSDRVSFQRGDVNRLPFDPETFDWVWSANCVGYPSRKPVKQIEELARVVRPGGRVAILIWSSQMLLPGYPRLEARLNATSAGVAPFTGSMAPRSHHLRALGWFREAGLDHVSVRTFTGQAHAPLTDDLRRAVLSLIDMRWEGAQSEVSVEDWSLFRRLSDPDSSEFILDLPDYYAFFTYSVFSGIVV